ncbi:MAG: hypothetical protein NUW09_05155 [Deltaproteobacteria bacterium]|nr:hypothetical protein [Deltaproteobacteria bacterium]
MLWNLASTQGLLEVSVTSFKDGMAEVSLVIPESLLKSFTQLLSSLEGFFTHVSWKTHVAKETARAHSASQVEKRKRFTEDFTRDILLIYDGFIRDGLPVKEAIRATNRAMKELEHPYACYDLVYRELQKAGRFRKKNRTGKAI